MLFNLIFLAFISLIGLSLGEPEDCFVPGECLLSTHIGGDEVKTKQECLEMCKATNGKVFHKQTSIYISSEIIITFIAGCVWFTFYPSNRYCHLLSDCNNLSAKECQGLRIFLVIVDNIMFMINFQSVSAEKANVRLPNPFVLSLGSVTVKPCKSLKM